MKMRVLIVSVFMLSISACAPKPTPLPELTVDTIGTLAVQMAAVIMTQTAAAYSPTPPPTETFTPTPDVTLTPTKDASKKIITVVNYTGCYRGPGPSYPLQSYINVPKKVELLGIGSVPGWYVINGPYFYTPCWVAAADVQIDPDLDLARFPVMTPGP